MSMDDLSYLQALMGVAAPRGKQAVPPAAQRGAYGLSTSTGSSTSTAR